MRAAAGTGCTAAMNPNRPAQASDQNLNGDMVFGLACASLVAVVLLVYALVFYDGRGKTRRIVDCLRHAGYTATVSRQPYIVVRPKRLRADAV